MDDYTRDLEEEVARYTLPNPFHHKRTWRLLFISSDGRVRQSGNYRQVLIATLAILLILMAALAATTGLWLHTKKRLAEAIVTERNLSATLTRQTADQERLMARLALAEQAAPGQTAAPTEPPPPPDKPKAPVEPAANLPPFVRVESLETVRSKDEKTLGISFKLFNDTGTKRRVKGHLFLVFPPSQGKSGTMRSLPAALLSQGVPSEPARGESFQMRNYSVVKFRLKTDPGELSHTKTILYVFDQDGTLRYKKEFPL